METQIGLRGVSFNFYKSALYLVAVIALIEFILFVDLASHNLKSATFLRVAITLLLLFGLWVQSDVARYLGAVWLLISVGTIIWPLLTVNKVIFSFPTILVFVSGALNLLVSYILLTKRFTTEFVHQQNTQPKYKGALKRAFIVVLILAVVFVTLNDVYHLFVA